MAQNTGNSARRSPYYTMADQLYPDDTATDTQAQDASEAAPSVNGDMASYIMQKGDTLWGLSKAVGIPLEDIHAANPNIEDATRIPTGAKINLPFDMRPYRGADTGENPLSQPVNKDTGILGGPDDSNCYKPEDQFDRVAKEARAEGNKENMGLVEYTGKFDLAMVKGAASLFADVFNGSKDTTQYLLDFSGLNGDEAKEKAQGEMGAFIDGTAKTGAAAFHGLWTYYNDSEVRDAVNSTIMKYAPKAWEVLKNKFWETIDDPDKAGRMAGRFVVSRGLSAEKNAESATKFFLSVMAGIGNLDRTEKGWKSKLDGLVFGADYANRNREQKF